MRLLLFVIVFGIVAVSCKSKQKATTGSNTQVQSTTPAKDLTKAPEKELQMQTSSAEPETELYSIETELMPVLKKYGVNSWKEVAIALEKTPCYGRCPSYRMAILTDGRIFYQGLRNVTFIGDFQCNLDQTKVAHLQQKLTDLDFFNLKSKYDMGATDLPSTHFYLNYKGKNKAVEARQGAPIALRDYANAMEDMVNSCGLKKADAANNE